MQGLACVPARLLGHVILFNVRMEPVNGSSF